MFLGGIHRHQLLLKHQKLQILLTFCEYLLFGTSIYMIWNSIYLKNFHWQNSRSSAIMLSIMKGREVLSRLTASLKQRFLPFVGGQQKVYVQICNIFFRTWNLIWILLYMLPLIQSWSRIPHDLWVLAFFTSRSWDGNALWTKIVIELNKLYISGAPCTADFTALCCLENKICKRVMMRITRYSQLLPTLSVMAKTFQF
jgi:hypothetical protein